MSFDNNIDADNQEINERKLESKRDKKRNHYIDTPENNQKK